MRVKKKSAREVFVWRSPISREMERCKKELMTKMREKEFLKWQYEKVKKEYLKTEKRVDDLKEFIELAERELINTKE